MTIIETELNHSNPKYVYKCFHKIDTQQIQKFIHHSDLVVPMREAKHTSSQCSSVIWICLNTFERINNILFSYFDSISRWNAPVSIALHAPGTDFLPTINSIKYLRDCAPESALVRQFTTFHIYFSSKHVPKVVSILVLITF